MANRFLRGIMSFVLLFLGVTAAVSADGPKAVFPETRFSFGTTRQGNAVEHEFVLKNVGSAPLRILGVRPVPFLMLARVPAQIQPNAEVRLRVRLDTSRLSGPFEGRLLIALNDPELPEATLSLEGKVIAPIELSPQPAFFVAGRRGESRQAALEIISHEPEPLRIESVQHPVERFTTKLETIEEGRRYRLSLILNPDGPGGKKTETILIKTSSQSIPLLVLSANTYLQEPVYTFPDEVDLGSLPLADIKARPELLQRTAQTLMVYQSGGSDFQVKLHTDLPMLDLKAARGPKGDRYQCTVTLLNDKLQAGPIKGSIVIETNDPKYPRLTVPVTGSIF